MNIYKIKINLKELASNTLNIDKVRRSRKKEKRRKGIEEDLADHWFDQSL